MAGLTLRFTLLVIVSEFGFQFRDMVFQFRMANSPM
jgi:hypothetical protein